MLGPVHLDDVAAATVADVRDGDFQFVTIINPTEVRTEFGSEDSDPMEETLSPEEAANPEDVAEANAFSAEQEPPNVVQKHDDRQQLTRRLGDDYLPREQRLQPFALYPPNPLHPPVDGAMVDPFYIP